MEAEVMPVRDGRYVRRTQNPIDVAAQDIIAGLLDLEIEIRRAATPSELLATYLTLKTLTANAVSLEKLALDRADRLQMGN
jgi:hypothetical protein